MNTDLRGDVTAADSVARVIRLCELLQSIADQGEQNFLAQVQVQWAVEMGLIHVSEAVSRIPIDVTDRFPDQPWRQLVAMRSFPFHEDDDLDPRRVWRTVIKDIPALRDYLRDTVIPGLAT